MLIESIEVKDVVYILINLKNAKALRLIFASNDKTLLWYQRLNSTVNHVYKLDELFAFTFYSWLTNEKLDAADSSSSLSSTNTSSNLNDFSSRYLFSKSM